MFDQNIKFTQPISATMRKTKDYDWLDDEEWIDFWLPVEVRLEISLDMYRATGDYFPDYTEEHILALFPELETCGN